MGPDRRVPPSAPTRRELRQFAFAVGGVFVALAAASAWRGHAGRAAALAALGGPLVVAGALAPARLGPAYRAWMAFAVALSRVTTPIFMGVVYFVVLTPLALVLRLAGRRVLGVRADAATAWVDRPPDARRSDLRRQF
jgi:hypothetical protein